MSEKKVGLTTLPVGFEAFWRLRDEAARAVGSMGLMPVESPNPAARYHELTLEAPGARTLRARVIQPSCEGSVPLALAFADFNQGVRGWHHLTRFVALGRALVALDCRELGHAGLDVTQGWREAPEGLAMAHVYTDALRVAHAALSLPGVDPVGAACWGEGLGGAMAVAVCSLVGDDTWRCAACNPLPAGIRELGGAWPASGPLAGIARHYRSCDPTHAHAEELHAALDYVDAANLASLLRGRLLVGTGTMDDVAPAPGQKALVEAAVNAASVRHVRYPRHAHERINEFENELVSFLS